jgi:hypothetical protein
MPYYSRNAKVTHLNILRAFRVAEAIWKAGDIPVTTHLMFPFANDEKERKRILAATGYLASQCNAIALVGTKVTPGMESDLKASFGLPLYKVVEKNGRYKACP